MKIDWQRSAQLLLQACVCVRACLPECVGSVSICVSVCVLIYIYIGMHLISHNSHIGTQLFVTYVSVGVMQWCQCVTVTALCVCSGSAVCSSLS